MEYKRLTERTKNNGVKYDRNDFVRTCYPKNEYAHDDIDRMAIRLAELEDKIEQGTLIELPCKVGDTVYVILNLDKDEKAVEDGIVIEIDYSIDSNGSHCRIYVDHGYIFSGNTKLVKQRYIFFEDEVFLTREEAEKRLKELQE